jgi:hypothetical protein
VLAVELAPTGRRARLLGLDAARGLAVLLMLGDHLAGLGGPEWLWYRFTLGRVALPLFFVVAGALVRRLTWRHGWVALLGLVLPVLAPWVDSPNVLWWYGYGAVVVYGLGRMLGRPGLWIVVLVGLVMGANGFGQHGHTYEPDALFGMMAVGALIGRVQLAEWTDKLARSRLLLVAGRWPLSVYVGHVLALQLVRHLVAR